MKENILEFWSWFSHNEAFLVSNRINNELVNKLNEMILSIEDFDWEIREGVKKENMLIISPRGDKKLLEYSKQVIDLSPSLQKWEFQHYKPAKIWDYHFSIIEKEARIMIDASDWEYVLLKFPDGTYDIIVKALTLKAVPKEYHYSALNIALDSILGEKMRIELIGDTEMVEKFPVEYKKSATSIKFLKDQLYQLEGIQ